MRDSQSARRHEAIGFRTPRGRQIDLPVARSFMLLGQIWQANPHYHAYSVLRICEALDDLPQIMAYASGVAAIVALAGQSSAIAIALTVGSLIGTALLIPPTAGVLIGLSLGFPLLLPILRAWNQIPEILRLAVPPVALGLALGWPEVLMWLMGMVMASVASVLVVTIAGVVTRRHTGMILGRAERCFLLACQLCAMKSNIDYRMFESRFACPDDETLAVAEKCLCDYASRFPQCVQSPPA